MEFQGSHFKGNGGGFQEEVESLKGYLDALHKKLDEVMDSSQPRVMKHREEACFHYQEPLYGQPIQQSSLQPILSTIEPQQIYQGKPIFSNKDHERKQMAMIEKILEGEERLRMANKENLEALNSKVNDLYTTLASKVEQLVSHAQENERVAQSKPSQEAPPLETQSNDSKTTQLLEQLIQWQIKSSNESYSRHEEVKDRFGYVYESIEEIFGELEAKIDVLNDHVHDLDKRIVSQSPSFENQGSGNTTNLLLLQILERQSELACDNASRYEEMQRQLEMVHSRIDGIERERGKVMDNSKMAKENPNGKRNSQEDLVMGKEENAVVISESEFEEWESTTSDDGEETLETTLNGACEEAYALDGECLDHLFSTQIEVKSIEEQNGEDLGKSKKVEGTKAKKKTQDTFFTTMEAPTKLKEQSTMGNTMSLHPIRICEGAIEYKIKTRGSPSPFASLKAIIKPELQELDPNMLQEYLSTKLTLNLNKETPLPQLFIKKEVIASPPRAKKKKQEEARILGYGNEEACLLDGACLGFLFSTTMENEIEKDMEEPIGVKGSKCKEKDEKKEQATSPPTQIDATTTKEPSPGEESLIPNPLEVKGGTFKFQGNAKEDSTPFELSKGVLQLALLIIGSQKRQDFLNKVLTFELEENGMVPFSRDKMKEEVPESFTKVQCGNGKSTHMQGSKEEKKIEQRISKASISSIQLPPSTLIA